MKLAELKNRLKSKYTVRIIAGVLTITLVASGVGIYTVSAAKNDSNAGNTAEAISEEMSTSNFDDMLGNISVSENAVNKEETVYVMTDAAGNTEQTIVVDHLFNPEGKDMLLDETTLTDIKNVKGDETFTQNGSKLTWNANGSEIFYQGKSDAKPPVTQKVTYFLDGKEISPQELAGKSGKVTIRFDYENTTKYTTTIDGEDITVCVPFAAITALSLDDSFSDVEVTNGKVKESGDGNIVIGYALCGIKSSLDIKDEDLKSEVKLPEYFELTANVENFKLSTCMTLVANASQFITTTNSSSDSLDDMIGDLSDATNQLIDGSNQITDGADALENGLGTLKGNLTTFSEGMSTLQKGLNSYLDGAKQLDDGITSLSNGTGTLVEGAGTLNEGAGALAAGAQSLSCGASELATGATSVSEGADAVSEGINTMLQALPAQMKTGINQMLNELNTSGFAQAVYASGYSADSAGKITIDNVNAVAAYVASHESEIENLLTVGALTNNGLSAEQAQAAIGASQVPQEVISAVKTAYQKALAGLYQGQGAAALYVQTNDSISTNEDIKILVNGAAALATGADSLESGAAALATGASSLESGASQLATGTQSLVDKLPTLTSGISQLKTGAGKLVSNNSALSSGASQLSDGTVQVVAGVDKLFDGSTQLSDGVEKLADGMVEFNEEGISKIVNAYEGDLKPLANRLQAMIDAGASYQTYTALSEGATGSVKFIYKLNY